MSDSRSTSTSQGWLLVSLLILVAGGWLLREHRALQREVAALRAELTAVSVATTLSSEPRAKPAAADPSLADELLALRGEVAAVRRERVSPGAANRADAGPPATASAPLPPQLRRGWLEAGGLPAGVLSAFQEQLGGVPLEGAHFKQSEGRFFYSTEAKLADGRHLELALDSEGNVVRRSLEQPLEALTPALRQAVQTVLGDSPDSRRIHEVFDDGRTVFRLTAKNPEQATIHVFTPDGQLLRSELIRREDKP
jgi:hypothetical protein